MRIRVPCGKERFRCDIPGSLLSPVIGVKEFTHLEAKGTFLLLFYCRCCNHSPEWAKPQRGDLWSVHGFGGTQGGAFL